MKTDEQLKSDIEDELRFEPSVEEERIGVEVDGSVVTLRGVVPTYAQKWGAERAAERVSGVKGIGNDLAVNVRSKRSDGDIARAAVYLLEWHCQVPPDRVRVHVEDGWITLGGELDHEFERRAAEGAVANLRGIKGVFNRISVASPMRAEDIKTEIEDTFKRDAVVDARYVTIEASGSAVVLRGKVASWHERREAEEIAWKAPGVKSVSNYIDVEHAA
jgi:osmotically-inducible protein OsmY